MKKYIIIAGIIVLIGIILLPFMSVSKEDRLVKNTWVWKHSMGSDTLEFYDDGTYDWEGWGSGKYSIKNNKLKLDRDYHGTYTYTYEIHGNELILNEEDSTNVFHLKKMK